MIRVIADAEPGELTPLAAAQRTIKLKTREVEEARYQEALAAIKQMLADGQSPSGELVFQRDEVLLHEQNRWEPEVDCEVQAIQVGPAVYVSNPAEYFCQFGLNIKKGSRFPYTWVVELANGCVGYVPTPEALGEHGGGYEPRLAMSSKLVPEAGGMIEATSIELANALTPGEVPPRPTVGAPGKPWGWGSSSSKKT